jgi:uncharacterized protein (DUF2141 family)
MKKSKVYFKLSLFFILSTMLLLLNPCLSQSTALSIEIGGVGSLKGSLQIGIYTRSNKFPKPGNEFKTVRIQRSSKVDSTTLYLPKGEYAIALFHDINNDGVCNRKFMRIPKEPYGFSNNIKPIFRAPSFEEAKIKLFSSKDISIRLIE